MTRDLAIWMMKIFASVIMVVITGLGVLCVPKLGSAANVILKMQVANPSKTDGQAVPLKVYLPKEVSPSDIVDLGDLKLDYDPDTGMYYVHDNVDLGPGESKVQKVEMKDVWVFTEDELSTFVNQAKEMAKQLEGTPYASEAAALLVGIDEKVQGILKRQSDTADKPSEHIRAYRQGISLLNTIRQDVDALEKLRQDTGGEGLNAAARGKQTAATTDSDARIALPGSEKGSEEGAPLGRSISMTAAWRLIFAILGFLGVLSLVFFMTWHRLLKNALNAEEKAVPLEEGVSTKDEIRGDLTSEGDTERP